MKILAVSDIVSPSLENMVSSHVEKFKDIDIIVSCGDLNREYLEFLVDGINRELFFITGNHPLDAECACYYSDEFCEDVWEKYGTFEEKSVKRIAGSTDLHGKVSEFGNYLIAGFGGAKCYHGKQYQYTEKEMSSIVSKVERKILWHRIQDKLLGKAQKDVIVISHAPIRNIHDKPDICHTGFECFRNFLKNISPLLWMHGHIHLENYHSTQISLVGQTTVVNVFGFKIAEIEKKHIQIYKQFDK